MREKENGGRSRPVISSYAPSAQNRSLKSIDEDVSDEAQLINSVDARLRVPARMPSLTLATSLIAVVDEHVFTRSCITKWLKDCGESVNVISFATVEDCIKNSSDVDLILYYEHENVYDPSDILIHSIRKLLQICPVIVLAATESPDLLIKAFETGVRGYIPTASTPAELLVEIIHLVRAGGTFVPPSSLYLHRIKRRHQIPNTVTDQRFTPRQTDVLNQLTQGKANKIIAYELAMSESTVKVHVRNIMKKMNASNRTEVVCRAQAFSDLVHAKRQNDED